MWDQTEIIQKSFEDSKQIFINAVNLTFPDHLLLLLPLMRQNLLLVPNLTGQTMEGTRNVETVCYMQEGVWAIKFAMRHFYQENQGRNLSI